MQLDIELRRFAQSCFYTAYLGHLAANMEMDQLQAIRQVFLFQKVERLQQLARRQAELAGISSALFPFAATGRGQLDADADIRADIQLFGHLGDQNQLVDLLDNQKNPFTHFLCQQSQLDIAFILIAVADDQRIGIRVDRNHRMEFGFGTSFQSQIELLAMADDLFHHRTHLIDFYGIDNEILRLITIFIRSLLETVRDLFNTVIQNIWETDQYRSLHIP